MSPNYRNRSSPKGRLPLLGLKIIHHNHLPVNANPLAPYAGFVIPIEAGMQNACKQPAIGFQYTNSFPKSSFKILAVHKHHGTKNKIELFGFYIKQIVAVSDKVLNAKIFFICKSGRICNGFCPEQSTETSCAPRFASSRE